MLSGGGGGGIIVLQARAGGAGVSVTSDTTRDAATWVRAGSNRAACRGGAAHVFGRNDQRVGGQ